MTRLAALTCAALLLVGCVAPRIPKSLDSAGKRVAVISLVSEEVRVMRASAWTSDVVYLDMDGQIRKTVERVFASKIATTNRAWVLEPLDYDRDIRFSQLREAAKMRPFMLSSYEEGIRAELSDVMRNRKLDAALLVVEAPVEASDKRSPGISVTLIGVPGVPASASFVSQADAQCSLGIFVVDGHGGIVAQSHSIGTCEPTTFDKTRGRFSYNNAENLVPPRVDFLRAGVVRVLTGSLEKQFDRLGL